MALCDLRPDRDLLDPNFNGYKLSLDSVPIHRKSIPEGIDVAQPTDDQFSFCHTKIFSLHNHLHVSPFSPSSIYFIDKKWVINKIQVNDLNHLESIQQVGKIPEEKLLAKGRYNVSISFPTNDLALLSNGHGTLYIIDIRRNETGMEEWKVATAINDNNKSFAISDARVDNDNLHVVLIHVEEKPNKTEETVKTGLFHTVIEWITLVPDEKSRYVRKAQRKLTSDGSVDYAVLEPNCKAIYIISGKIPKWEFDSENPVIDEPEKKEEVKKVYSWTQTNDGISITITFPEEIVKSDLNVSVEDLNIQVKCKDETIVKGDFFQRINKDCTSWSFDKNKLEIQLKKNESGLMWKELIPEDKTGEEIINPEIVGEVHEKLAHLCSDKEVDDGQQTFNSEQLEECDTVSCDTTVLIRTDTESHKITHEISLSTLQWLFQIKCNPELTPAICLRHDVDACVWQLQDAEEKKWPSKHIGTFFAFGYVQASKTQKKFLDCPKNMSYAAICEITRHIYVYRQPSAINGELRNRVSGTKVENIAKQQLINLDINEQILGVYAMDSAMFVLTENVIHLLVINE